VGRSVGARLVSRPQAREQLVEGERLREVVVGPGVETGHAILDSLASGQHQHRRPDVLGAKSPADLEAVEPGQHHVEDDHVEARRLGHPDRFLTVPGDIGCMPFLAQAARQQLGKLALVLDDQHPHGCIVAVPV